MLYSLLPLTYYLQSINKERSVGAYISKKIKVKQQQWKTLALIFKKLLLGNLTFRQGSFKHQT